MKKNPFISLVVVNYNGASVLKLCLDSLLKIDYPKDSYEIIVVDNSSTDEGLSIIAQYSQVKLIENEKNLGYVGVNSCLEYAKGEYIFVLNNDLEIEKNCIKRLVATIEKDEKIGIVAPKFINFYSRNVESSGTWVSRSFYTGHYTDKKKDTKVKEIPYLGIEMLRKNLADKFGYIYDPDYFIYGEDLDLSLRFKIMGYKTVLVPNAVVYHMHAYTTKKQPSERMTFLLERNLMTTFFKVMKLKTIALLLPYVLLMRFIAVTRDLFTGKYKLAFARIKALFWIMVNIRSICRKRKKLQKLRVVNDSFVLSVFSEKYLFKKKELL